MNRTDNSPVCRKGPQLNPGVGQFWVINSDMIVEESDPVGTAAAVDRLVHHSVILQFNIESCRIGAAMKNRSKKPDGSAKGSK